MYIHTTVNEAIQAPSFHPLHLSDILNHGLVYFPVDK